MSRTGLFAIVCLLQPVLAAAQADYPNTSAMGSMADRKSAWYRQCLSVQHVQPPARELPPPGSLHGLRGCGAENLYYDTRARPGASPADWDKVRHCAYAESDASVLMMLYANGYGVSRNDGLAVRYACSLAAAPAEMDGRVAHLNERMQHHEAQPFDQCDDITSGFMGSHCAAIEERLGSKERSGKLAALMKSWQPGQQAAAARLQQALEQFAARRADQETDMSGTLRGALAIEARAVEMDLFAHDVRDAERGKLPRYSEQQYQQLDKKLNQVYQRLMQHPQQEGAPALGHGTVTKEGVTLTQRAWLAYRDAWVALGAARYPGVAPHAWKALLTQRRIEQLEEFES
ncbi:lysozyme inhibitor LprI family protein [Massilia sp. Root351]|uniref:lysozyme inhibitor LprI family protein n=1 Tax=Massilia sp. Root351 TaxID=1736522 RepID=UPI000AB16230|nr:lysozyme inhibitor LprI family protein [Massilia sp. Root351]